MTRRGGEPGAEAGGAARASVRAARPQDALAARRRSAAATLGAQSGGAIAAVVGGALLLVVLAVARACAPDVLRLRRGAVPALLLLRAQERPVGRDGGLQGAVCQVGLNVLRVSVRVSKIALVLSATATMKSTA